MESSTYSQGYYRSRIVIGLFLAILAIVLIQQASELVRASDQSASIQLRTILGNYDPLVENFADDFSAEWQPARDTIQSYFLVQFDAPLSETVRSEFEANGITFHDYIPHFAYIVHAEGPAAEWLQQSDIARWVGNHAPAMRVAPGLADQYRNTTERASATQSEWILDAFSTVDSKQLATALENANVEIIKSGSNGDQPRLLIRATIAQLPQIAGIDGVSWVEALPEFELQNDIATEITGVAGVRFGETGYYGEGQVIAIADSGLDRGGLQADELHDDFEDGNGNARVLALIDRVGDGSWDKMGHGTHVAGTALGNGTLSGADAVAGNYSGSNAGVAPRASLVFQAVSNDSGIMTGLPFQVNQLFDEARASVGDGNSVHIHSNSWGSSGSDGYYSGFSRDVDRYMWENRDLLILFSAGNSGRIIDGSVAPTTVIAPGTAKNVLTVGATQNSLESPNEVASYSGTGPTLDGRIKPDLVAPGIGITSVASQQVYDEAYVSYSGTSMATPHVAGMAALVREYFGRIEHDIPTAALIKAMLINGADGTGHPNMTSGWGRADIMPTLGISDTTQLQWWDSTAFGDNATTPLATGEQFSTTFNVMSSATPIHLTLVWTDAPGSPAAFGGLVNDLNMHLVAPNGTIYYPSNANSGGLSGEYDHVNNVLGIHVENPEPGDYEIVIMGYNVTQDKQDWSLVARAAFANSDSADMVQMLIDSPGRFAFGSTGLELDITETNATEIIVQRHKYSAQELLHGTRMLANAWTVAFNSAVREPYASGSVELTYDEAEFLATDAESELSLHILQLTEGTWEPIYPDSIDVVNNRLTLNNVDFLASSDWAIGFSDPTAVSTYGFDARARAELPILFFGILVILSTAFFWTRKRMAARQVGYPKR